MYLSAECRPQQHDWGQGVEVGIWIEQITPSDAATGANAAPGIGMPPVNDSRMDPRYMRGRGEAPPPPPPPTPDQAAQTAAGSSTNSITLVCRAVSLTSVDSSANTSIAYAVENEIKNSPLVDPKATQLSPNISPDDPVTGTFTFTVNVTLNNPMKF